MTANEAIKILEVAKAECEWNAPLDYQEAFDLAISALQAQLTCNKLQQVATDTISRQAAVDAIGKASDELYENIKKGATFPQRQWFDGMAQAQSILENLPSAQPELCDDAVSRQNVIETIKDMHGRCDTGNIDDYCDLMVESLSVLTPVTPKRKTGKWVNNIHDLSVCDQCGYMTPYDRAIDDYEYGNYCPNCGAKMNGGDGIKEGSKDV